MANQDQVMIDLDFSRVNELFHYMETLHTQTSEMIMCLQSLQKNIQDSRKRFIGSLTKPYFQEEEVVRFKETSNEIQHVLKRVSDIRLGDDEDFNPAGQSGDAAMRAKRLFFGSIVMKAFEDMMGSDSLVKRLEQDLHITIAAARSGVTFKKKEGGEGSEQKLQILRRNCEEGFKKEQDGGRKSLKESIKECNESDKEFGVLNAIKVQAVEVGIELSHLMVDFVFMMSGKEQWTEKIGSFKSALKGLSIEDVVINKIINLQETEKNDEPMKGEWAGIELSELDQSNQKKILYRRSPIDDLFDKFLEQALDLLCDQFIVVALHLESIMCHPLLLESQDSMNVELSTFKCGLKQSEEMLIRIGEDINKLKAMFSSNLQCKDYKMTNILNFVESMIVELWNQSESSSKME